MVVASFSGDSAVGPKSETTGLPKAIARKRGDDFYWFWIGSHEQYNRVLKRVR